MATTEEKNPTGGYPVWVILREASVFVRLKNCYTVGRPTLCECLCLVFSLRGKSKFLTPAIKEGVLAFFTEEVNATPEGTVSRWVGVWSHSEAAVSSCAIREGSSSWCISWLRCHPQIQISVRPWVDNICNIVGCVWLKNSDDLVSLALHFI